MSQAEILLDRWRTLPPEQQQALISVAAGLADHPPAPIPKRNLKGLWADQGIDLDEQDLRNLRREKICYEFGGGGYAHNYLVSQPIG
jgi:hypothetical protein